MKEVAMTTGAVSHAELSPPTNQHPTSYRPDALPVAQPTVLKHQRKLLSITAVNKKKLVTKCILLALCFTVRRNR